MAPRLSLAYAGMGLVGVGSKFRFLSFLVSDDPNLKAGWL